MRQPRPIVLALSLALCTIPLVPACGGGGDPAPDAADGPDAGQADAPAPAACGNGEVGPDEACDDGNTTTGDGCSALCVVEASCPADAAATAVDPATGHCYAFWDESVGYGTAANACTDGGGTAPSITSAEEQALVAGLLGGKTAWLGLNDFDQDGTFTWLSMEPLEYVAWKSGQPDNAGGAEKCVFTDADGWSDEACNATAARVCELVP